MVAIVDHDSSKHDQTDKHGHTYGGAGYLHGEEHTYESERVSEHDNERLHQRLELRGRDQINQKIGQSDSQFNAVERFSISRCCPPMRTRNSGKIPDNIKYQITKEEILLLEYNCSKLNTINNIKSINDTTFNSLNCT